MLIRTFLDTGVLVEAWKGREDPANKAFLLLQDPSREFVSTRLVALETLGHALYGKRQLEVEFYEEFFANVVDVTLDVNEQLVAEAMEISAATDADGIDALHLAAAVKLGAEQLITLEGRTKPLYRESRVTVLHLDSI